MIFQFVDYVQRTIIQSAVKNDIICNNKTPPMTRGVINQSDKLTVGTYIIAIFQFQNRLQASCYQVSYSRENESGDTIQKSVDTTKKNNTNE